MSICSLKNQPAFDKVNKFGTRVFNSYFTLVKLENASKILSNYTDSVILGMKVSKKLGPAVTRNKIKRRIRHLIRLLHNARKADNLNLAIIIIPKKNFELVEFQLLYNSLSSRV